MTRTTAGLILAFLVASAGLAGAAPASVRTWRGTIMCGSQKAWAQTCPVKNPHFVFVSGTKAYEISRQNYSGFKDLVGKPLKVTAELNGKQITILELMATPAENE